MKHRPVSSMHLQSLKLLRPKVSENKNYKKREGRTDRRTTDRFWYEINIPYFSNETEGK